MAKTILWYGESGSFKTTQLLFLAKLIYELFGKKTRVWSCDLGGWGPLESAIQAGLIEGYRVRRDQNPLPQIRMLSKGYWPTVINGKIGFLPPTDQTWKDIGGVFAESLTSIGDLAMEDVVNKGQQIAEEVVGLYREDISIMSTTGNVSQQAEKFGAPGRAHYNFAQKQVYGVMSNMAALPCELAGFTALESKAEDTDRSTIYGPSISGKAATPKVPSWAGDCLHFDSYQVEKEVPDIDLATGQKKMKDGKVVMAKIYETKVRAFFMRHPDPKTGINHPAKPRIPPEQYGKLLAKWPGGYFEPTVNGGLDEYVRFIHELEGSGADEMKKWREDIDKKLGRNQSVQAVPVATPAKV